VTALLRDRQGASEKWGFQNFTLASGNNGFRNAAVGLDVGTGKIQLMAAARPNLLFIGHLERPCDASSADKSAQVRFPEEKHVEWFENSAAGPDLIAATDLGKICYFADDQTVALTPGTGRARAGRVWSVTASEGVAVELLPDAAGAAVGPSGAFAANDLMVPAAVQSGSVIDIPTTAGASTVTLPAAAPDGTILFFSADGTKNGHTVTYRDATGPTALTTALTAVKRHLVTCVKVAGKWTANAYVSP
jgi:hypothetical protein